MIKNKTNDWEMFTNNREWRRMIANKKIMYLEKNWKKF
jgi:hypothetical protein